MRWLLVAFALPLLLNPIAWWRLARQKPESPQPAWRRRAAYIGLVSGSAAYVLPLAAAIYNIALVSTGKPVRGEQELDVDLALRVSLCLLGLTVVSGLISPKRIRILLVCSALCAGFFWVTVPRSVL
jgi:hypothetical protein